MAVTSGGSQCSTYAHCAELLAAGDDINYTGPSGPLDIDETGDVARGRLTTWVVESGELVEIGTDEVDLLAERADQLLAAAVFTAQLQQALRLLGFYDGDVNGVFDEATAEAVRSLQRELGVPETGAWDEETDAAFRARFGDAAALLSLSISDLQRELQALGYYDGPIDGRYSEATIAAVRAFQRDLGVPETGLLDLATLRAIYARGQQNVTPPEPPPPPPPPPTTAPPVVTTAPPVVTTAPPPPPPPPSTTTAPAPPTTEAPPPDEPTMLDVLADESAVLTIPRAGHVRRLRSRTGRSPSTVHTVRPHERRVRGDERGGACPVAGRACAPVTHRLPRRRCRTKAC